MDKLIFTLLLLVCGSVNGLLAQGAVPYGSLYTDATFNGRTINTALPVGTTPGQQEVTITGAAAYRIPIAVPGGTQNIQPELAITYNSQGGNGLLGKGWSLGGLSTISRVGKNIYLDGKAEAVKLNTSDPFALDDNRLVLVSGTHGTNGASYRTENETFSRITAYGAAGSGPQWFKVETKSGLQLEYGNTTDSRFLQEGGSTVMLWRLNKVTDAFGNYMQYIYTSTDRDSRISEIRYSGNSVNGLSPDHKVQFFYQTRTDDNVIYIAGSSMCSKYLLTKIVVTANSSAFKEYHLKYGFDQISSYLTELSERGTNNSSLNATIFKYGSSASALQSVNSNVIAENNNHLDLFDGDFNGDGSSDLMTVLYTWSGSFKNYNTLKLYTKGATASTFTNTLTKPLPTNLIYINNKLSIPHGRTFLSADFNGDSRDDILLAQRGYDAIYQFNTLEQILIYQPNTNATALTETSYPHPSSYYNEPIDILNPNGPSVVYGDFDGDGRTDYLTLTGIYNGINNTQSCMPHISFPYPGSTEINKGIKFYTSGTSYVYGFNNYPDQVFVLDFDGSGTQDLMLINGSVCDIYTFSKTTTGDMEARKIYSSGYPTKWHDIYLADFNGDGKTDLLTKTSTNLWEVAYSKGSTFQAVNFTFANSPNLSGAKMDFGDFNGDGLTDILLGFYHSASASHRMDTYYSNGDSFYYQQTTSAPRLNQYLLADFNGDGKNDFLNRDYYLDPVKLIYFNPDGKNHLLHKIADGFNLTSTFDYRTLSRGGSSHYLKATNGVYPVSDVQLPFYTVNTLTVPDGINGNQINTYSYEGAKVHQQGRGWLGFTKMTTSSNVDGMRVISEQQLNTTFYVNLPWRETTQLTSNSSQVAQTTYANALIDLGNKRYFYRINSVSATDNIRNTTEVTTYTYDPANNGNITQEVVNRGSGLEITTINHTYGTYAAWIPSKITQTTVSNTRSGEAAVGKTVTRTYDAKGSLTSEVDFSGLAKAVTTTYSNFDLFGNPQTVTTASPGLASRSLQYKYNSRGRFVTEITNALGQKESRQYDSRWGLPNEVVGIDAVNPDLSTQYYYDAFGRLFQTIAPGGHQLLTTWTWDIKTGSGTSTTTVDNSVYYTLTTAPGKPDLKVWYDKYGRERQRSFKGFNGQWVNTVTSYDARGNVRTSTTPFYSGGTPVVTNNNYDSYNRTSTVVNATGTTTYTYSTSGGYKTTMTNPAGQVSSSTEDATGKVISTTDNGGTLTFAYFSSGNQKNARLGSTELSAMTYDVYGRQQQLVDKNAGTTQYVYNAFGELTSQTDARGNISTMTYDQLGRVLSTTTPEGTTTYQYVSTGYGMNQVKKVTNYNGYYTEYTYDSFNRPSTLREHIDGASYTTTYGYDTYSNVTTITYPSGFVLKKEYDAAGYLNKLKNSSGSITLFSATSVNAFGQYTGYTLGNGKASTMTYDSYGLPDRFTTAGVQDLDFTYQLSTGNLTSRADVLKAKTESFLYDNLNRLTNSTVTGQSAITVGYHANGNISSKTGVGTMSYHNTKIHALDQVSNPNTTAIPTALQNVSYSSFQQPTSMSENGFTLNVTYGANGQRRKAELKQGASTVYLRRYVIGGYEQEVSGGVTRHIHYINGGDGLNAIVVRENGVDQYYYVYKDQLGSILSVTNASGTVLHEQNFDAWGRSRNPVSWTYSALPTLPAWLYRGYTGHEHLPQFGLINMNNRMYDPVLGRMLSPDNYVQDPSYTQSYNRYSYAFNNPLSYSDPTGDFGYLVAFAVAAIHAVSNPRINTPAKFFGSIAIGTASSFAGNAVGTAAAAGIQNTAGQLIMYGVVSGGTSSFITGFGRTMIEGGGFSDAFLAGWSQAITGATIGGVTAGVHTAVAPKANPAYAGNASGEAAGTVDGVAEIDGLNQYFVDYRNNRIIAAVVTEEPDLDLYALVRPSSTVPGGWVGMSGFNTEWIVEHGKIPTYLRWGGINGMLKEGVTMAMPIGWFFRLGKWGTVAAKGANQGTKAFRHTYKYHSRIRARALQDPVAHNFPYSFDDVILKAKPITQADGSLLFRQAGSLNGKSGFFEIALNPQTKTIFHRTFVGVK